MARLNIATAVRAVGVKAPGRSFNGGDGGGDDGDAEEERRTPPGDSGSSGKGAADGRQLQSDPLAAAPGREGVAQPARPPHTRLCSGKWLTWHSLQQYQTMTPSSLHRLQQDKRWPATVSLMEQAAHFRRRQFILAASALAVPRPPQGLICWKAISSLPVGSNRSNGILPPRGNV